MTRSAILDMVKENDAENVIILEGEEFDGGCVGIANIGDSFRLVYDYDKMVDSVAKGMGIERVDAADLISYDTM